MNVSLTPLDDLAATLRAGGVRSASRNPAEVNTPGVWVRFTGFEFEFLGGYTITATLHLVVADNGIDRSASALVELLNKVTAVVDPTGPVVPQSLILPSGPKALPGLAAPIALHVT